MDYREESKVYKNIIIIGTIQGVGFRPFIKNLATKCKVCGRVKNIGGAVEIFASCFESNFQNFIDSIKKSDFDINKIVINDLDEVDIKKLNSNEFIIEKSDNSNISDEIFIQIDMPTCDSCLEELFDSNNRRHNHPFISCASCGPRFSIIEKLPYDRENTSMIDFKMCDDCKGEYTNADDKRFHAQTVSCHNCGPYLIYKRQNNSFENNIAFEKAIKDLKDGKILAIKGIGGYHFACSPYDSKTIENLRLLKSREQKPFAVMFRDIEDVKKACYVNKNEENLLKSKVRPIVLLNVKYKLLSEQVNQGGEVYGCFLPYTPLQHLLLHELGALVMTSANLSDNPIIKDDEKMLNFQNDLLCGVLYNERKILRGIDDSVVKAVDGEMQIIRRSRGFVPTPIEIENPYNRSVLAVGGDLKSTFLVVKNNLTYLSQYLGDLENIDSNENFKENISQFLSLFNIKPDLVVCDYHPKYFSSKFAKSLGIEVLQVQHHHAHIASVMAEHKIDKPVIGVSFDGTGYGLDGNVWGGEFFICDKNNFLRYAHLDYVKVLGGDESMKDAKKTATCYLKHAKLDKFINDKRTDTIKIALKNNVNSIYTSSMGRLFDAVSSILEISDYNRYEGQCAIMLEELATRAKNNDILPYTLGFSFKNGKIKFDDILLKLCEAKENEISVESLAYGFHIAVADMILKISDDIRKDKGINIVALSGGVFQNKLLTELTCNKLRENNFIVYINRRVPPNDSSIALGQAYIALNKYE